MTSTRLFTDPGRRFALMVLVICSALIIAPACAVTMMSPIPGSPTTTSKYLGGSPSFSASIVGTNEFSPGDDVSITILVKNAGVSTMKQLNQSTMVPDDLPTTAKFAKIGLTSTSDSIIIKTDPQRVNTILSGDTGTSLTYKASISTNATDGVYTLPVIINYQYPNIVKQEKDTQFVYTYNEANVTVPVTIRIKPLVKIDVVAATPDPLAAGTEGYLTVKIKNDGPETGRMASAKLIRAGSSGIIPTSSTVFIGTFPSGNVTECIFRIAASTDATEQVYPVDVAVSYTDSEGATVTSQSETIGIPVSGKITFTITSPVQTLNAGSDGSIEVTYRNNGNLTIYDVQSQILPHTPVTSADGTAYLGTLLPGESATARYDLNVDGSAEPGTYSFDSKLRFRDALQNSQESDTIQVPVEIVSGKSGATILGLPITTVASIVLLVAIIAGIGYYLYRQKKSLQ